MQSATASHCENADSSPLYEFVQTKCGLEEVIPLLVQEDALVT